MRYKITIGKIEDVTRTVTEWEKLYDKEAFEEISRANSYDPKIEQYGYKKVERDSQVEAQIYEQTKDGELDLMAVITAFNK